MLEKNKNLKDQKSKKGKNWTFWSGVSLFFFCFILAYFVPLPKTTGDEGLPYILFLEYVVSPLVIFSWVMIFWGLLFRPPLRKILPFLIGALIMVLIFLFGIVL